MTSIELPSRPRVLLVDDDDGLRRALARALRRDFRVTEASDGRAAIELLAAESFSFDAVVTDLEMPGVSGDQVVAWLDRHCPALAERVLILSGGASTRAKEEWLCTLNPARLLKKPCPVGVIIAAIRGVLDPEREASD